MAQEYFDLPGRNDSQATSVYEGKISPWLTGKLVSGEADILMHGSAHHGRYIYLHLDRPINFAAYAKKDNYSTSENHVYDLSLSTSDLNLWKKISSSVGQTISVRGGLMMSPTGSNPPLLYLAISEIQFR